MKPDLTLLPWWTVAPFVLLLAAIALGPVLAPRWWERHSVRVAVALSLGGVTAAYIVVELGTLGTHALGHAIADYVAFMAPLAALYTISGGILIRGSLSGTPLANTALLGLGALLASVIGTIGASLLLVRPLLRANEPRRRKVHLVVFFILVVSNCGGLLTPLGDPPLYIGYLRGVPFEWTLGLWGPWLLANTVLLVIFSFVDQYLLAREEKQRDGSLFDAVLAHEPLRIEGWHHVGLLVMVLVTVVAGSDWPFILQETTLIGLALVSYLTSSEDVHAANRFDFEPLVEIGILFAGIFLAMIPPVLILNAAGPTLGVHEPWQFFWAAGGLSAFLDNAPTYLAFASAAAGQVGVSADSSTFLRDFLAHGPAANVTLAAISCGSTMMGALTYIGNGPNFMVKAIAEAQGVKMPGFFAYLGWSSIVLIPTFVAVTLVFFA